MSDEKVVFHGMPHWFQDLGDDSFAMLLGLAPVDVAAADVHEPAANTAAVVTYSAVAVTRHVITGIAWSYVGAAPTGGSLKVEDGSGTTVFIIGISDQGAGYMRFPRPIRGSTNTDLIVTLAAGGSGVTGKISVLNHWAEA